MPKHPKDSGIHPYAKILIVDDEPLVLEILELAFRQSSFDVVTANTSQLALKLLDRGHFDALISDVRLEHIDGFDLLKLARRGNPLLVAILITGAPQEVDAQRASEMSADYVVKPLSLSKLISRVKELMSTIGETESVERLNDERSVNATR